MKAPKAPVFFSAVLLVVAVGLVVVHAPEAPRSEARILAEAEELPSKPSPRFSLDAEILASIQQPLSDLFFARRQLQESIVDSLIELIVEEDSPQSKPSSSTE